MISAEKRVEVFQNKVDRVSFLFVPFRLIIVLSFCLSMSDGRRLCLARLRNDKRKKRTIRHCRQAVFFILTSPIRQIFSSINDQWRSHSLEFDIGQIRDEQNDKAKRRQTNILSKTKNEFWAWQQAAFRNFKRKHFQSFKQEKEKQQIFVSTWNSAEFVFRQMKIF